MSAQLPTFPTCQGWLNSSKSQRCVLLKPQLCCCITAEHQGRLGMCGPPCRVYLPWDGWGNEEPRKDILCILQGRITVTAVWWKEGRPQKAGTESGNTLDFCNKFFNNSLLPLNQIIAAKSIMNTMT